MNDSSRNWYALKIYTDRLFVRRYLDSKDIEVYIPIINGKYAHDSIIFVFCTEVQILKVKADWPHSTMLYLDAGRPQAISYDEMENFKMVLSLENQELRLLEIYDKKFLEGQKVRVLDGPLKGAIGVMKRFNRDRKLVVSVAGIVAVATSFVHPSSLGKVE